MNGQNEEETLESRHSTINVSTRASPLLLLDRTVINWRVENFREDLKSIPIPVQRYDLTIEKNEELPKLKWRLSLAEVPKEQADNEYKLQLQLTLLQGYERLSRNEIFCKLHFEILNVNGSLWSNKSFEHGPIDLFDKTSHLGREKHIIRWIIIGHGNLQRHLRKLPLRPDGSLRLRITFQHFVNRLLTRSEKVVDPKTVECWLKYLKARASADEEKAEGKETDVQIISSDGKTTHFHKDLLIARSPVFAAMFQSDMKESQSGIVKLDDLTEQSVNLIHHFIYNGRMLPCAEKLRNGENLEELDRWLYITSKYQFEDLINFFDKLLPTLCNEGNATELLKLCNRFSLMSAREDVKNFIIERDVLNNIV